MSAVKRRKQKLGAGDRAFNIVLGGLTAVSVLVILYACRTGLQGPARRAHGGV